MNHCDLNHPQPECKAASESAAKCFNQSEGSSAALVTCCENSIEGRTVQKPQQLKMPPSISVGMWTNRQMHSVKGQYLIKKNPLLLCWISLFHVHLRHSRCKGPLSQHSIH